MVGFEVWTDGENLYDSGMMTGTVPARRVGVPLNGRLTLRLFVSAAGDNVHGDHASWAGASFRCE